MKYLFLALMSALLLSVSWPTYGVPFFIFFALVPLLLMEHSIVHFSRIKRKPLVIFLLSYLAFIIWNIVTTGWLYGSKNPDGSHSIPAVVLPVITNSLLYSLVFMAYHYYKKWQGTYWALAFFVVIWMSFEKLHLEWELTWPWLNLGNAFSEYPKLIQWYDTLGSTGGSFWILLVNIFAFYTIRIWEAGRKRKDLIKNLIILTLGIIFPMIISVSKYHTFDQRPSGEASVLLLQPELDPYSEKYSKDSLQILNELLQLASENAQGQIDYFIAPETAIPGYGSISENSIEKSVMINTLKAFTANYPKSVFATGISSHRNIYNEAETSKSSRKYADANVWRDDFNSSVQVSLNEPVQIYHKGKLVPGVEIIPFIGLVKPVLGNAMINLGGTVASLGVDSERKIFTNPYNAGKLAPIICYESVYGEFTTDYVKKGANFLAIMTNDSWWGVTEGHRQLLSYARLRAIETRREIARSANSGISAHINALGEVEADTFYGDRTTLYAKVKLYENKTFYVRAGDFLSRLSIFTLGFLLLYGFLKRFQYKK